MNAPLRRFFVVGLTLFVLAAWQFALHVPESSGEYTITTEKEFRTYVVGKKNVSKAAIQLSMQMEASQENFATGK